MNLVIVESPAKAKTINKYLGKNYLVLASYGHVRDLPSKNGSVDPENNFKMEWELDSFSKKLCQCVCFFGELSLQDTIKKYPQFVILLLELVKIELHFHILTA